MRDNTTLRSRALPAARFSALVIAAITGVFLLAMLIVLLGVGASPIDAALALSQAPGITLTAFACGALTLFLLTVSAPPTTRWGFAWRGAVAASVSVVVAPLALLLTAEWIPGRPGAAGGFFLVFSAIISYVLVGGPVWAGLITVLLRRSLGDPNRNALAPSAPGADLSARDARPVKSTRPPGDRRRLGLLICATGAFVALGITFLSYVPAMYKGADYKCLVEGPSSPLAEISERPGLVTGSFSLWPLGRECTWRRADGTGTVSVNSGNWAATGFAASAALLSLAGAGLAASARRRSLL